MNTTKDKLGGLYWRLLITFLTLSLISCGGKNGSSSAGVNNSLFLDQVSTVPLINDQAQSFYVYATNTGNSTISNITWTIDSLDEPSSSASFMKKAKVKLSNLIHNKADNTSAIVIKDFSECTSVGAGQSCRIQLQANNSHGVYQLHANSDKQKLTLLGGAGIIYANNYTPVYAGNLADSLTISPISEVNYGNGVGSSNFFIINNNPNSIELDIKALEANLPANAKLSLGNCPQPLPSATSCQVRITLTNLTNNTNEDLDIPIVLKGKVITSDAVVELPEQNFKGHIIATTKLRGTIQYLTKQTVSIDNSYANLNTVSIRGVISNTGTSGLTINSIVPNGQVLSVAENSCSGKTLGQGEICSYKLNLDVSKISGTSNDLVKINYIDLAGGEAKSVDSDVTWMYTQPLPLPAPGITLHVASSNLNQVNLTTILTVTNTGNVALSDISPPIMRQRNPYVSISDGDKPCTGTLAVNSTCNYIITYTPEAPSEDVPVIFSGMSASHPDNRGSSATSDFINSITVNISSIFAGMITSNTELVLDEVTSRGNIVFTNTGNYTASISEVEFTQQSSTNLLVDNASGCINKDLAPTQSCTVSIKLNNSQASGSDNGVLEVTYDDHNGNNHATSSNNISWLIGDAPSLQVTFANDSLVAFVGNESSAVITLKNNGRNNLANIMMPSLSANLSYSSNGSAGSCKTDGTQSLAIGEQCALILKYTPPTRQASTVESLSSFSASYTKDGSIATYTTSPYAITLVGLTWAGLELNPSSVTLSTNWANNKDQKVVELKNVSDIPFTINSITSDNRAITTDGCVNTILESNAICSLKVSGEYSSAVNGIITLVYTDAKAQYIKTLNVTGNYSPMIVLTPSLALAAPSLSGQALKIEVNTTVDHLISLTNNTTGPLNADRSISIPKLSLSPANSNGVSYTISTDGISDKPCDLSQESVILAGDEICNYYLKITGGSTRTSSTNIVWEINYKYNGNTNTSIDLGIIDVAIPVIINYSVAVTSAALLVVHAAYDQDNNFNAIEQGLANPTLRLVISNSGTGAVSGNITSSLPSGIIGDFSACVDLEVGGECFVDLTMSTTDLISGNLNTISLSYNNGNVITTANLPSILYSVIAYDSPAINMLVTVDGCKVGNGTDTACMNNPDNKGGTARSMKVKLTFTNGSTTGATRVTLPPLERALFTDKGYTLSSSSCNSGIAKNSSCVMEYSIPAVAASSAINPDISASNFRFDYDYTTAQGQNKTTHGIANLDIDIDVVDPVLSIKSIGDIKQGESTNVAISWSSLYQTDAPSVILSVKDANDNPVSEVTFVQPICPAPVAGGAQCTAGKIITTDQIPVGNDYKVIATSANEIISEQLFNVLLGERLVIFVTSSTYPGNLGGMRGADVRCNDDANKPTGPAGATYKALLNGNNATIMGTKYYRTDRTKLIATATDGNLVGANPLDDSIQTTLVSPWTGANGMYNCNNWTSSSPGVYGSAGNSFTPDSGWWNEINIADCSARAGRTLYCVQQP